MKNIKDYLHLYLGQQCLIKLVNEEGYSSPVKLSTDCMRAALFDKHNQDSIDVKLVLRPLSDMTEEEAKELFIAKDKHVKIQLEWTSIILTKNPSTKFEKAMKFEPGWRIQAKYRYPNDPNGKEHSMIGELSLGIFSPLQFQYLLSKGFDLFGLIDAGLAIDKTTLKP